MKITNLLDYLGNKQITHHSVRKDSWVSLGPASRTFGVSRVSALLGRYGRRGWVFVYTLFEKSSSSTFEMFIVNN